MGKQNSLGAVGMCFIATGKPLQKAAIALLEVSCMFSLVTSEATQLVCCIPKWKNLKILMNIFDRFPFSYFLMPLLINKNN